MSNFNTAIACVHGHMQALMRILCRYPLLDSVASGQPSTRSEGSTGDKTSPGNHPPLHMTYGPRTHPRNGDDAIVLANSHYWEILQAALPSPYSSLVDAARFQMANIFGVVCKDGSIKKGLQPVFVDSNSNGSQFVIGVNGKEERRIMMFGCNTTTLTSYALNRDAAMLRAVRMYDNNTALLVLETEAWWIHSEPHGLKPTHFRSVHAGVKALAVAPGGNRVAFLYTLEAGKNKDGSARDRRGSIQVCDAVKGNIIRPTFDFLPMGNKVFRATINPLGKQVAATQEGRVIGHHVVGDKKSSGSQMTTSMGERFLDVRFAESHLIALTDRGRVLGSPLSRHEIPFQIPLQNMASIGPGAMIMKSPKDGGVVVVDSKSNGVQLYTLNTIGLANLVYDSRWDIKTVISASPLVD